MGIFSFFGGKSTSTVSVADSRPSLEVGQQGSTKDEVIMELGLGYDPDFPPAPWWDKVTVLCQGIKTLHYQSWYDYRNNNRVWVACNSDFTVTPN